MYNVNKHSKIAVIDFEYSVIPKTMGVGQMKIVGSDHHSLEGRILIHKHDDIIDGLNNPATYNNPMNLGPLSFSK